MRIACPLFNNPYYSYTIDLSGDTYTLTFRYSSRANNYLMDIQDAEDNYIIRGVKLVPVLPLTFQYSLENPKGQFFLLPYEDTTTANSAIPDPRRVDRTHFLIYDDFED